MSSVQATILWKKAQLYWHILSVLRNTEGKEDNERRKETPWRSGWMNLHRKQQFHKSDACCVKNLEPYS